jgi:hypothetical protein
MKKIFAAVYMSGFITVAGMLQVTPCFAQPGQPLQSGPATIRIAANTQYDKAKKFKRLMLGDHYRKEWATPVDIEILDMDTEAGGLTPVKLGGGLQTSSLRLKGANGKQYVLRSVNKDPSKAIVSELRGTFADDVVQDQISSSNPYAPLVVSSLAEAAGIFHSKPRLVYVPASHRLTSFAETFSETLCLFEERPAGNEEDNAAYGYATSIINSQKLFDRFFSSSQYGVDAKAFVKARLFDMLIGDWDRHEDQWLWAGSEKADQTIYKPIARDRDQAFPKMDGIIPQMATRKWAIRKIQDFDEKIRDINGLNMAGIHLDRIFTNSLTLKDWLIAAQELKETLTEEVIDAAFREMPEAIFAISGKETVAHLKQRRYELHEYATDYYLFLSKEVNITGTKEKEIFEVNRITDDSTTVIVYSTNARGEKERVIFKRTFLSTETKEIRLYGLQGDDIFNINGTVKKGILIRVIGGKDEDSVTDYSIVKGGAHRTKIYDDADNDFHTGKEARKYISDDSLKNDYHPRSFRFDWLAPLQSPGYNPDDGIYLGGGLIYKKQKFGKAPYGHLQSIGGYYAFKTGAYSFWYTGIFKETIGKWDLHLGAKVNAPNYVRNYYGLGNETERLDTTNSYYRVRFNQVIIGSSLQRQWGTKHSISAGAEFQSYKVEQTSGRFISSEYAKLDSSDFGRIHYGQVQLTYQFNTVDNPLYPRKGIRFNAGVRYTQNIREGEEHFTQIFSELSSYISKGPLTIASRTGISTNAGGSYEFFQANTLGGLTNLRGYRRDRFSGKTSVYQNTELRWRFNTVNAYLVKGAWGVLAFMDRGRVWMPDEDSKKWHYGYGGGVWLLPFNRMALTATYGISKEDQLVTIKTGFLF